MEDRSARGNISDADSLHQETVHVETNNENESYLEALISIAEDLECVECTECVVPPIKICSCDQIFCSNCSSRVKTCFLCQSALDFYQNTLLNQLVSDMPALDVLDSVDPMEIMCSMAKYLECPVCQTCVVPPIKTCPNGHGICQSCLSQVETCPLCKDPWRCDQNKCLDDFVSKMLLPCQYREAGCTLALKVADKARHESECEFKKFDCPVSVTCDWRGILNQVADHLKTSHADYCFLFELGKTYEFDGTFRKKCARTEKLLKHKNLLDTNHLLILDNEIMTLQTVNYMSQKSPRHYVLLKLGNSASSSKYRYRLSIGNKNESSLTFVKSPIPHDLNFDNSFWKSDQCVTITRKLYTEVLDLDCRVYRLEIFDSTEDNKEDNTGHCLADNGENCIEYNAEYYVNSEFKKICIMISKMIGDDKYSRMISDDKYSKMTLYYLNMACVPTLLSLTLISSLFHV